MRDYLLLVVLSADSLVAIMVVNDEFILQWYLDVIADIGYPPKVHPSGAGFFEEWAKSEKLLISVMHQKPLKFWFQAFLTLQENCADFRSDSGVTSF